MTPVRNRHLLLSDLVLIIVAAYLSFLLRLDSPDLKEYRSAFLLVTGLALICIPLVFWRAGIYARYWRYASVEELLLLAGSVTVGVVVTAALSLAIAFLIPRAPNVPRSIPFIFLLLALVATAGSRLLVRLSARSTITLRSGKSSRTTPQPVLIMGAGDAGAMIVRELKSNPHLGLEPVGFLDDDLGKHDVRIHGIPVLGDRNAIPEMAAAYHVKLVIMAMPTASGKAIREVVAVCTQAGVQTRIVPGLYELLGGAASVSQLRDVQIEDLLRREPVQTDPVQIETLLRGKRVLVTGGGGSIGAELCRQIMRCRPAALIIVGHGENSIFDIHNELCNVPTFQRSNAPTLAPIIADIRFPDRVRAVFETYRPEIVFHAAAHKHVPLMEENPGEAITNNVLGTRNLLDAALATGVERFVMISTDKAVNPTSVMGASKRVAELLVYRAAQRSGQPYVAVRFGNVLGSRGSVVLTFKKQIAAGGPITVTHPEMKRYFMTIPEAVQLVLQAAVLGQSGEIFVLDMGDPVRILDLAQDLIRLSGLEMGRDIDIVYTGLRPGEKLYEELFIPGESYRRTSHQKIFMAGNGIDIAMNSADQDAQIDRLITAASQDPASILPILQQIIPEFRPPGQGAPQEVGASPPDASSTAATGSAARSARPPLGGTLATGSST